MKKITKIFSFIAAMICTVTLFAVSANAAEYEALYQVTTTTNTNDTATWDFTGNSVDNTSVATGSTVSGIVLENDVNNASSVKYRVGYLDIFSGTTSGSLGGSCYVPVPAGSAGSIGYCTSSAYSDRYFAVSGDVTRLIVNSKTIVSTSFTADDIVTYGGSGSYVKLTAYSTNTSAKRENKVTKIQVVLTTGSYVASAAVYDVNIYDDTTLLDTQQIVDGSTLVSTPNKWGYDFVGYYTDSSLNTPFDVTTPITANIDLYTKWTAWEADIIANDKELDASLVTKLAPFGTFASDTVLTGTIYTVLNGCSMTTSSGVDCIGTGGAVSTSNKGVQIEVPISGVITAKIGSGGTSARNAMLLDSEGSEITAHNASFAEFTGTTYDPNNVYYDVQAGTYYLGGSNGMRIYSINFVADGTTYYQRATDNSAVRFLATVGDLTDKTFGFNFDNDSGFDGNKYFDCEFAYGSLTTYNDIDGLTIADSDAYGSTHLIAFTLYGITAETNTTFQVKIYSYNTSDANKAKTYYETLFLTVTNGSISVTRD